MDGFPIQVKVRPSISCLHDASSALIMGIDESCHSISFAQLVPSMPAPLPHVDNHRASFSGPPIPDEEHLACIPTVNTQLPLKKRKGANGSSPTIPEEG